MKKLVAFAFGSLMFVAAPTAHAQQPTTEQEVLAVVQRMFEGFAQKDTALIRSALHTDVKLVTAVTNREGKPVVRTETMDAFLQGIAKAEGKLDEKLFNPEVRIEDNLATVWTRYEFWYNDKYSHCGVDSFQLARTEGGWKIFSIADTRKASCK